MSHRPSNHKSGKSPMKPTVKGSVLFISSKGEGYEVQWNVSVKELVDSKEKDVKYKSPEFKMWNSKFDFALLYDDVYTKYGTGKNNVELFYKSSTTNEKLWRKKGLEIDSSIIIEHNGTIVFTKNHLLFDSSYGFSSYFSLNQTDLLEDDMIRIRSKFWIREESGGDENNVIKKRKLSDEKETTNLNDSSLYDVVIICNDGVKLETNKCILGEKSPVFKAMFESPMIEAKESKVDCSFPSPIVQGLFNYIQYGRIEITDHKNAKVLLEMSNYYQIKGLKSDCEEIIASELTVKDAAEVLILSDLCNSTYLKKRAIDFINRNKEVTQTPKFQNISINLLKELYMDLWKRVN